jgi:hypothetical protein
MYNRPHNWITELQNIYLAQMQSSIKEQFEKQSLIYKYYTGNVP